MQVFVSQVDKCRSRGADMIGILPIEDAGDVLVPHSNGSNRINKLIKFNKELEKQMDLIKLNESFLESKLEELESILSASDSIERYSLGRLTELTLFCVGNYANNNCITEV